MPEISLESRPRPAGNPQAASLSTRPNDAQPQDLIDALRVLGTLWAEWNREDRQKIANLYRTIAHSVAETWLALGRGNTDDLSKHVGRCGGWVEPIISVMFPDWREEGRVYFQKFLMKDRNRVVDLCSVLRINWHDGVFADFVSWLDDEGLYGPFLAVDGLMRASMHGADFSLHAQRRDGLLLATAVESAQSHLGFSKQTELNWLSQKLGCDFGGVWRRLRDQHRDAFNLAMNGKENNWALLSGKIFLCGDTPGIFDEFLLFRMKVWLFRDLLAHGIPLSATKKEFGSAALSCLDLVAIYWLLSKRA